MKRRKWIARITSHPWSHLLTLGIHIDLRHPLIEIHFGPFIFSVGRFYRHEYGYNPSVTEWITTHPDEEDGETAMEWVARTKLEMLTALHVPKKYWDAPPETSEERAAAERHRSHRALLKEIDNQMGHGRQTSENEEE